MKTWLLAAATAIVTAATVVACGGTPNFCESRNVRCEETLSCDPSDGVCKCGGRGGVVPQEGFVCDPNTNTLVSQRCGATTQCSRGTSCDVYDGKCKCGGTGGIECGTGTRCDPATKACVRAVDCGRVACSLNQVCDPSDGQCKCGTETCTASQFCSTAGAAPTCVTSLCSGVSCTGENVCDPNDGYCKCNGALCQGGEACGCPDGGACEQTARTCVTSSACANKTCTAGTTCDPADGVCKCGGPGNPPGPVCGEGQICSLGPPPQCQGGQQCVEPDGGARQCGGGTSCDPEDGACKCGGRGGQECRVQDGGDPGEICVATTTQINCRRPCDPTQVITGCPAGTACFYDSTTSTPSGFCATPTGSAAPDGGTNFRNEGQGCSVATACYNTQAQPPRSLHCVGLAQGQTGLCRPYCRVSAGTAGCSQVQGVQTCVQIAGAPADYGFCNPQ